MHLSLHGGSLEGRLLYRTVI